MAVRQLPSGLWQADAKYKGIRERENCDSEIAAAAAYERMLGEIKAKVEADASQPSPTKGKTAPWTLSDAVAYTKANVWRGTKAERSSVINADAALDFFKKSTLLSDIDTTWIDDWKTHLIKEHQNSGSTINRKLAALSKVLAVAVQRDKLDKKPYIEFEDEGEGRIRYATWEEEASMLAYCHQWSKPDHADALAILIDTGFRYGEMQKISSQDVAKIQVKGKEILMLSSWVNKGEKPRSVPLTSRAAGIINRRMQACKDTQSRLFPFGKDWLRNVWDRLETVMALTKDPGWTIHCLRHTCCSRLVQAGVPLIAVKEWMGHKRIETTMRYAHLAPGALLPFVHVLERPGILTPAAADPLAALESISTTNRPSPQVTEATAG